MKTRLRNLQDLPGTTLVTDKQRSNGLVKDLFGWNDEWEKDGSPDSSEYEYKEIDDMEDRVRRALMGTKNSSAPGPDGLSYRLIKVIRNTCLGEELISEGALHLWECTIPGRRKEMRMVLIPKLRRDLINCQGKLGEQVVLDHLQDADLLHHHQFGAVRSRSAVEVVFWAVVKVRRYMDGGGDAA